MLSLGYSFTAPIDITGRWWPVGEPDKARFGRLIYSHLEGVRLEIEEQGHPASGALNKFTGRFLSDYEGVDRSGKGYILSKCQYNGIQIIDMNYCIYSIRSNLTICGKIPNTYIINNSFYKITSWFTYVDIWLKFGLDLSELFDGNIKREDDLSLDISIQGDKVLTFKVLTTGGAWGKSGVRAKGFAEAVWLGVETKDKRDVPYDEIWEDLLRFRDLLTLLTGEPLRLVDTVGYASSSDIMHDGEIFPNRLQVLRSMHEPPEGIKEWSETGRLNDPVKPSVLEGRWDEVAAKWWALCDALPVVRRLLFDSLYAWTIDISLDFLRLAQTAEVFHSMHHGLHADAKSPKENASKWGTWLENRIQGLIERYGKPLGLKLPADFASVVAATRHELTHYGQQGYPSSVANDDDALYRTRVYLSVLLQGALLMECGLPPEDLGGVGTRMRWVP